jgi:hypothetical protein
LLVPPADSGSNTSTIIGSIGKSSQYVNIWDWCAEWIRWIKPSYFAYFACFCDTTCTVSVCM